MPDIKLVAPFTVSCNNHQSVLNVLKQKPAPVVGPISVFQIPVRSDVDVSDIVRQNDRKMPENFTQTQKDQNSGHINGSGDSGDIADDAGIEEMPASFVDLGAFQPTNRLEQVTTVFLQDFPALRPKHVENVISLIVSACPLEAGKEFRFSVMAESINDTRGVFVRLSTVKLAHWAKLSLPIILPDITAIFDESLSTLAAEDAREYSENPSFSEITPKIAAIFANKKLYSQGSGRSGTEDLDEVMQYYKTYKVENSELVEVPKELKEVIVRDIIKFRAKVLTLEREARKKEIEKERRKAKLRLTSIFEGIRESATENGAENEAADMDENTDESSVENPLDSLNDEEYDEHVAAEDKRQQEESYVAQLAELHKLETTEKNTLLERLHAARNYESGLIENKLSHMDEFKNFENFDASNGTFSSAFSAKVKLYYNNHGEYLRLRSHERAKEETMDDEDRENEAKASDLQTPTSFSTRATSDKEESEAQKPLDNTSVSVVVSALSEFDLAAVKEKAASLVEEFLGIREDLLIDFIYGFVVENNLERGEELIAELQETLDEDSKTVVDQLHEFIASI